mgnify:CR=1 FL=1
MSHITVRLSTVGLFLGATAVCGLVLQACKHEQQATVVMQQSAVPLPRQTIVASTHATQPIKSECSALDDNMSFVANLAKLAQLVEPMSEQHAYGLARGALLRDAKERVSTINVDALPRATTVCVVRHTNDDNEVVWRVEFPGNKEAIIQGR